MNSQIFRNISFNLLAFIINVLITLILTPYIIKHLGLTVYGIVPIALFISSYIGVVTQSLTASINRYLINALQKNNFEDASNVFMSSLVINVSLIIVFTGVSWRPLSNLGDYISIPAGYFIETSKLFYYTFSAVMISLVTASFSVSMYCNNRLDLMQASNITKNVIKGGAIFLFFENGKVSLEFIGISIVISEMVALLWSVFVFLKLTPYLLDIKGKYKFSHLSKIAKLSFWLVLDQLGFILLSKIDLLLLNRNYGATITGKYSIITQLGDLLRAMAGMIGGVLGPVMMILYSRNEQVKMAELMKIFMSFLSLSLAIPVITICIYANEIVDLWIGQSFDEVSYLAWFILAPLIINLGATPLFSINVAYNKVILPSLMNIIVGCVGISIVFILMHTTTLGYLSIPIGLIGAVTCKNAFFMPLYAAHLLRINILTFIKVHAKTILFSICYFIPLYFLHMHYKFYGMMLIPMLMVACSLGFLFSILFYSKEELNKIKCIVFLKRDEL